MYPSLIKYPLRWSYHICPYYFNAYKDFYSFIKHKLYYGDWDASSILNNLGFYTHTNTHLMSYSNILSPHP